MISSCTGPDSTITAGTAFSSACSQVWLKSAGEAAPSHVGNSLAVGEKIGDHGHIKAFRLLDIQHRETGRVFPVPSTRAVGV